jgi:ABC-2 type transport system permease protein
MNKTLLIIKREYLSRVRKKSFVIMTILGPLLMAATVILPAYLADWSEATKKRIAVLDETGWFEGKFKNQENITFYYIYDDLETGKEKTIQQKGDMLLYIRRTELSVPTNAELFSTVQPGLNVTAYIRSVMKKVTENKKLLASGIDPEIIKSSKVDINLITYRINEEGVEKKSNTEVEVGLAIFAGILIYFFIFMFGAQVLKGVMEEKSSRIVEVIISSVKPFQLMTGKIVGIAMVGLTQFILWIILTMVFLGIFQTGIIGSDISEKMMQIGQTEQIMSQGPQTETVGLDKLALVKDIIEGINFKVMIFSFIFYFLGGYLLYASLFAAIGGAVDQDADTQQFMFPVSLPLIFSVMMTGVIINQPDSSLSVWLSLFPFTSPVIMMMRIPFGVPLWQVWTSAGLLILGFIGTTWLAAKIYRTGILMYGKKVNYAEIWKWLKNKS